MSTFQRGDKNIANASGQVVREDMEDTLKATAANNFGPLSNHNYKVIDVVKTLSKAWENSQWEIRKTNQNIESR